MIGRLATKLVTASHSKMCVPLRDEEVLAITQNINSLAAALNHPKLPPPTYPKAGQTWVERPACVAAFYKHSGYARDEINDTAHGLPRWRRRIVLKLKVGPTTASGITLPGLVVWKRPGSTREYSCTIGHWTREAMHNAWFVEDSP
jgi:hypothetical protein